MATQLHEDVERQEQAIATLKDLAYTAAMSLTIAGRNEQDIVDGILLCREYQLCRSFASDTVLREVVEQPFDSGVEAGRATVEELERARSDLANAQFASFLRQGALELRQKELETNAEMMRQRQQRLQDEENEIRAREARVTQAEDLDAAQRDLVDRRTDFAHWAASLSERIRDDFRERAHTLGVEWGRFSTTLDLQMKELQKREELNWELVRSRLSEADGRERSIQQLSRRLLLIQALGLGLLVLASLIR